VVVKEVSEQKVISVERMPYYNRIRPAVTQVDRRQVRTMSIVLELTNEEGDALPVIL